MHGSFCRPIVPVLYAQSVEAQPVDAPMALHHAELIELLLARGCASAYVPLLGAHDLVEAVRGAV